jgi:mannose-6-phosphate isomerase-like protein (cupin superfamily)
MNVLAKDTGRSSDPALVTPLREAFVRDGVAGPVDLLSNAECQSLVRHVLRSDLPAPLDWPKGRALADRVVYELATMPRILELVRSMLGEDVLLWSAVRVIRRPYQPHGWHTDVECSVPEGRFATVWIGLQHVSKETGLVFAAGSHRFGKPIQQIAAERGIGKVTDEKVAELAAEMDGNARIERPDITNGQAFIFDGRIWHAGRNDSNTGTRISMLLQYATADTVLRMPLSEDYSWPFKLSAPGRLPALLVSGQDRAGVNRLLPPPAPLKPKDTPMIGTQIKVVDLPLAEDPVKRWRVYNQFRGPTSTMENMSCHISVLSPGHTPHLPHIHPEEELLVVLDGEVEIALATHPQDQNTRKLRLRPGMFSYYPSTQHHTINNPTAAPVTYLMFKWNAGDAKNPDPLQASVFEYRASPPADPPGFFRQRIFEQATDRLGKLHAHLTVLQPGAGYDPHVDPYDAAILLLSGEVETAGQRVRPFGIIYYSAGEPHGIRNPGTRPATYLVFEFHSPAAVAEKDRVSRLARALHTAVKTARRLRERPLQKIYKRIKKLLPKT